MTAMLAGLALGLASSAHCAAMCGPLVLTIGRRPGPASRAVQLRHALLHHTGRIAIYALLALPAGLVGQTLVFNGMGRVLAVGSGILLLAAAAGSVRPRRGGGSPSSRWLARLSAPVVRWAAVRPVAGPLATGAVNGVLPCGLVYAAVTAAGAAGSVPDAVMLMAGFGAGTSLVLVAMSVWAASFPASLRIRLRPLSPVVLAVTAVILIARGVAPPHRHPVEATASAVHAHHR
jgi:sulfite exporter TauE/SafE